MSSFSWLDFSEHDRRRSLEVINLFRDKDTVDELGFGSIRDGFSNILFPATSVLHTRARYLFFIPWLYQGLEAKRTASAEVAKKARAAELRLIDVLLASADNAGTIGKLAREKLKMLPSAIYWPALHQLGIRLSRGTRDQYHRSLDRFYRASGRSLANDDGEPVGGSKLRNWHPRLPAPPADFPERASLTLRPQEAEFLRERIIYSAPRSLYRHMVEGSLLEGTEFPWEHQAMAAVPAALREQLDHAENFSLASHGAPLLYNLMLAELAKSEERIEEYRLRLTDWKADVADRGAELASWNLNRMWQIVAESGARVTPTTRAFVERWLSLAFSMDAPALAANKEARTLIHERERQLKRGQARLDSPRALDLWSGEAGVRRLEYRWSVAVRMARDIHVGLDGGGNA